MSDSTLAARTSAAPGPFLSLMLMLQRITPLPITVLLVTRVLGPQRCARMAPHMRSDDLLALTLRLPPAFTARVATHLHPRLISTTLRAMPDQLHLEIGRALMAIPDYLTTARFADHLTENQIRAFIVSLNDPEGIVSIAPHLEDPQRVITVARRFSDAYLLRLLRAGCDQGRYELTAQVLQDMAPARQTKLLEGLQPQQARTILACFPASTVSAET